MARGHGFLALEYIQDAVPPNGSAVLCSLAAPVKHIGKDAAGHIFHDFALKQSGLLAAYVEEESTLQKAGEQAKLPVKGNASTESLLNAEDQPPPGTNWKSKKKKKKKGKDGRLDLYALLGLQNERWTATDAQIKLAYRKAALEHHPDKAGAATADKDTKSAIEEKFKAIQEAYETLSDPAKRREFDSTDDFDDTLPMDCAPEDFLKVFGPAFRRNSRWSVQTPVPEVGDEGMPFEQVDRFYDFWFSFKSWREFPHPDEEDVEQAECREEKRWLERMNAKLREQGKKEEKRRLKEFVENAYRCDPRIIAYKEAQRAERERKKMEKHLERQRRQELEERALADAAAQRAKEEARAAESAAEARKQRQLEKKATQKERARLRGLTADQGAAVDEMVELLCANLQKDDLAALNTSMSAEGVSQKQQQDLVKAKVEEVEHALYGAQRAKEEATKRAVLEERLAKRAAEREKIEKAKDWSEEEVRMLEKALDKFPPGTVKRWETVAAYVRTRTVNEVLDMVKHGLKAGKFAPKQDTFNVAKKRQGNTVIASEASSRMDAFTDVEVNLSGEAAQRANGHPSPRSASKRAPAPMPALAKQALSENGINPRPSANGKSSGAKKADTVDAWSEDQEALKQYKPDHPERWDRVANAVEGKTKQACRARYKELREVHRAKKS